MKFLADECCNVELVDNMRSGGYDVKYVLEDQPGAADAEVLSNAYRENRTIITEDKDFGELVYRLKKEVNGIILLRFTTKQRHLIWPRLQELFSIDEFKLEGKFIVVDARKFRIRSLVS